MSKSTGKESLDINEYLSSLINSQKFGPQVVRHKVIDSVEPQFYTKANDLDKNLFEGLKNLGISKLYAHQGEAIKHILQRENIVVSTPTSSGKSLIYNIPVLHDLLNDSSVHALYLFPLKALSQDQFRAINELTDSIPGLKEKYQSGVASIYDGDTTTYQRKKIRENPPPIIMTNPDMLHLSILPFHESWVVFLKKLKYVVIDEVHTYRGVFGSHISWVVRRLKRVAEYYGAQIQFILSSATIGNPKEFSQRLINDNLVLIDETGGPKGKKNFLLLNPWDSAAFTASQLLEASIKRGLRTIVYTQSRKMTELISLWTKPRLGELESKLSSYRAGFLAEERRDIEARLSDGSLLGVISTSALELGIDIGDLDLCVLVGYPGSIMASYQRGGRVGRGGRESAVVLIGSEDALDQYYMNNPDAFFEKGVENAVINPENEKIIAAHAHCAAAEIPLNRKEFENGGKILSVIEELAEISILLQSGNGEEFYASRKRPQRHVSLRGGGESLSIINGETGLILGEIDSGRALKECHEGAIYLHKVDTWFVKKLDLFEKEVVVYPKTPRFHTRAMSNKNTEILSVQKRRSVFGCTLSFGDLRVTEKVTAYQKRNNGTNKLISTTPLDLPEQIIETEGCWLEIPGHLVKRFEQSKMHYMGGLHAFEHILISVFPIKILCDRNDIGGISCPQHEQTESSTIFLYDGHPGGSGLNKEAFFLAEEMIMTAIAIVKNCECETGCPACVHSPKCGSGNRPIDKMACLTMMEAVVADKKDKNKQSREGSLIMVNDHKKVKNVVGNDEKSDTRKGVDFLPDHYGVFDVETKLSAEEVGGWHNAEKMGVSVGVVYDSMLDGCVTYLEHEMDRMMEHLFSLDLVVGFNNKQFDNRVLTGYSQKPLHDLMSLDILEEIKNRLGYRLSLNGVAQQTLGVKKTSDGLQALEWYKEGRIAEICKYCKKDVEITRDLFHFALENGYLLFRNKAKQSVRVHLQLENTLKKLAERVSLRKHM